MCGDHACGLRGIIPTRVGTTGRLARRRGHEADHPHTRGDHAVPLLCLFCGWGSSPHAWGPRIESFSPFVLTGIIPTRVGTTHTQPSTLHVHRDHPHTRGDHAVRPSSSMACPGSSPHAWGPRGYTGELEMAYGIIPTRVGTTRTRAAPSWAATDHPHTRGDH